MARLIMPDVYSGTFQHEPLSDAARYIRLLEVLDDNYSKTIKIRCRMTTWLIEDVPPYFAVSYTWGDPESISTILINGQSLNIRTNCEFVLKQACWYKPGRYYWVDAICIDQNNHEEKGTQVSIMGKIYQRASRVLACVGDHGDDSRFLFQRVQQSLAAWLSSDARRRMIVDMAEEIAIIRRFLWAVVNFTQRSYFTRLWILQEQKLARHVTFLCGPDSAPKDIVRNMTSLALIYCKRRLLDVPKKSHRLATWLWKLLLLPAELYPVSKRHGLMTDREDARIMKKGLSVTVHVLSEDPIQEGVLSLLDMTSGLQCEDNKDRIYGIISLLDWVPADPVKPDYTKTDFEVALDFILAISRLKGYGLSNSLTAVSQFTRRNLGLTFGSDGVSDAVEARRGPPTIPPSKPKTSKTKFDLNGLGYIVRPGSLSEGPGYMTWTPSMLTSYKVYLPPWVKRGDFIVFSESACIFGNPIVLRLVPFDLRDYSLGDERGLLIGQGVCESSIYHELDNDSSKRRFRIRWDIEDEMVFNLVSQQLSTSERYSAEWISALNIGVCRKETPVSSYGSPGWSKAQPVFNNPLYVNIF